MLLRLATGGVSTASIYTAANPMTMPGMRRCSDPAQISLTAACTTNATMRTFLPAAVLSHLLRNGRVQPHIGGKARGEVALEIIRANRAIASLRRLRQRLSRGKS